MSLGLVPVLVVGFVLAPLGTGDALAVAAWAIGLAVVGTSLYRRSVPRWSARYRRG